MSAILKSVVLALFLGALSGCTTIYFHRGASETHRTDMQEWHHDGILELVEFSDPVAMNSRCENKPWQTIKVEKDALKVLITGVTWGWYDPWDVSYQCGSTGRKSTRRR